MIRWAINAAIFVAVIVAAIIFFRFRIEGDELVIKMRDQEERGQLIESVKDVKRSTEKLADSLSDAANDGKLSVELPAIIPPQGTSEELSESSAEKAKQIKPTPNGEDNLDSEKLEDLLPTE